MEGRKVANFWDKISLTGFKWSNLNAPSTETLVSHSLLSESLFPIFSLFPFPITDRGLPKRRGGSDLARP